MRRDSTRLMVMLNMPQTDKNLTIIIDHIESGATDPQALLDQLGRGGEKDLHTVETWYKTL